MKTLIYTGRAGRPELRGQRGERLATWRRRGPHNVLLRIDGELVVCPIRCTRRGATQ